MAKKLSKGKRKHLISLVKENIRAERVLRNAMIDARRIVHENFQLRQNRAYMSIYC
jgi:hypothetical protein